MNTQKIDLDISKPDAITPTVTIGQGDKGGTTIEASIYDGGAEVSLAGKSAMLEVRLPDGKSYVRDAHCTVSGNKITYIVDEEHVGAIAGITDEAYFDILDGPSVIYSTNRFRLRILRSAHDGAQPAESWDSAVDDLIERGEAAIEDITKAFVPVSHGGTGATDAAAARANLNAASQDDLDTLRDSVSPDKTVSIVQKPADATGGSLCYWKSRGVTVVVIDSLTFPTAGTKTLTTLPEGYRPLHYIAAPTLRGGTGAYMEVSPNGVVRVSVSDASQWVFGTIAY